METRHPGPVSGQKSLRWLRLAAGALLVAGCSGDATSPADPEPPDPPADFTTQELQIARASNGFGVELLREVVAETGEPNLLLSPLSASMALGMTLNGAAGGTFDAMRSTLGFGDLGLPEINRGYRGLITKLRATDPEVEFVSAGLTPGFRTCSVAPTAPQPAARRSTGAPGRHRASPGPPHPRSRGEV